MRRTYQGPLPDLEECMQGRADNELHDLVYATVVLPPLFWVAQHRVALQN
jgi:hypothetical protein